MRKIKFRAWDTHRKVMIQAWELGNDELQIHPNGRGFFNASSTSPRLSEYYPHLTPMQFTGLFDKSGDILFSGNWTVRDEFAAKAMLGLIICGYGRNTVGGFNVGYVAEAANGFADALLKEREKES